MKKFALAAAAGLVATMSLAHSASAEWRNDGDDSWRRNGHHMEQRDDGDRDGGDRRWHDDRRGDDDWRRDRWRDHHGWRHDRWRRDGYWGGRRIVIRPGYDNRDCFIKKVIRTDDWGNVYVKRIPVCR